MKLPQYMPKGWTPNRAIEEMLIREEFKSEEGKREYNEIQKIIRPRRKKKIEQEQKP